MPSIDQPAKRPTPTQPLVPYWQTTDEYTTKLYLGDVLSVLRRLPSRSVHCVVTSPPYWGLRDYGTAEWVGGNPSMPKCKHGGTINKDGNKGVGGGYHANLSQVCRDCGATRLDEQLGSEATPEEYIAKMVAIFRVVHRVLRQDGSLWLNLGDSYSGGGGGNYGDGKSGSYTDGQAYATNATRGCELPPGNLVGIPWRVALALQADGWVLRQDIIWFKPGPMPESVTNRCTKAHEYMFLLTKGKEYFYDQDAIREPHKEPHRGIAKKETSNPHAKRGKGDEAIAWVPAVREYNPAGSNRRSVWTGTDNEQLLLWMQQNAPSYLEAYLEQRGNKLDVWKVASQAYPGAHYATYPKKLIIPCIKAGTSEHGCCPECMAPYKRRIKKVGGVQKKGESGVSRDRSVGSNSRNGVDSTLDSGINQTVTLGWKPTCNCQSDEEVLPCIVLDPFIGSGTTASVCIELGRACWGIDLSKQYLNENAIPRISGTLRQYHNMRDLIP